jgi:transcriptional regulator with XRE-family HTH domain
MDAALFSALARRRASGCTLEELAREFGLSLEWLESVLGSDGFQVRMASLEEVV